MTAVLDRYAAQEAQAEAARLRRARRQPLILIALVNALIIGVAITAVIDLRRLHTASGTALVWTQAAVFGDCDDYLTYSVADPSVNDSRTKAQLCRDLRAATAKAREVSGKIGLRLLKVDTHGGASDVLLEITRDGTPVKVTMHLDKLHGRWRVVRNAETCGSVGCP